MYGKQFDNNNTNIKQNNKIDQSIQQIKQRKHVSSTANKNKQTIQHLPTAQQVKSIKI